jgi:hypothetical protein
MMLIMFISGAVLAAPPVLICAGIVVFITRQGRAEAAKQSSGAEQ